MIHLWNNSPPAEASNVFQQEIFHILSETDGTKIKLREYKLTNMGYEGHFLTISTTTYVHILPIFFSIHRLIKTEDCTD